MYDTIKIVDNGADDPERRLGVARAGRREMVSRVYGEFEVQEEWVLTRTDWQSNDFNVQPRPSSCQTTSCDRQLETTHGSTSTSISSLFEYLRPRHRLFLLTVSTFKAFSESGSLTCTFTRSQ